MNICAFVGVYNWITYRTHGATVKVPILFHFLGAGEGYDFGTILKAKIKIKAQLAEHITLIDNHKHRAGYAILFTRTRKADFRKMKLHIVLPLYYIIIPCQISIPYFISPTPK